MRIAFLSRILPNQAGGPQERCFLNRITELTDLGHDVLILTRWQDGLTDLSLPKRVEVRYPFRRFAAWEWPRALPLILHWRPELIHIVDPGLASYERLLGAEASLFPVLEGLRKGFPRLTVPRILVSTLDNASESTFRSWAEIGAKHIENEWLSLRPPTRFETEPHFTSHASTEFLAATPRIKVLIAGRPSERLGFFRAIPTLLDSLQQWPNLAVGVVLDRAGLTRDERRLLMQWERRRAEAASRVLLIPEAFHLDALRTERWDVGVLAGLPIHAYQRWQELLPIPLIGSEAQVKLLPQSEADPRVMARVSEVAWLEQSLALSQKSELREQTRIAMQVNAHRFFKDDATNRISRMYAVALADGVSAS